jgi:guanylate kinase
VTSRPSRGLLVVVSGPSGVGKGTVVSGLLDELDDVTLSTSVTTRSRRPGETDGDEYHFVDDATFDRLVAEGALLEWATYAGNRYGTLRGPVDDLLEDGRIVLLEIEVQGARQVRGSEPEALLILLVPPSVEELSRRLSGRGTEDEDVRARRLAAARAELAAAGEFDHTVVNDDLDGCVAEVAEIIRRARDVDGGGDGG